MMENAEIALSLKNISYSYKGSTAPVVKDFSLDVAKGSFTTLLGPSGCGKTTLLRLISGFLVPSTGTVELNGINQKGIEPDKRKIGMVFQDYALFPHMTVRQNILFGLKIKRDKFSNKKLSKEQQHEKAAKIAENLDLQNLMERFPNELSGGQQQRVALARALVLDPEVLLMDEPLSSLDTKLREKVREELKMIQQKLKITTVYVTHDQEEALSLSDKIAVINDGALLQYGTPRELYFKPQDDFTADFVGRANFVPLENETYIIRPEWFELNKTEEPGIVEGKVVSASFLGDRTRFVIAAEKLEGKSCNVALTADLPTLETNFLEEGGSVSLNISHKWKI